VKDKTLRSRQADDNVVHPKFAQTQSLRTIFDTLFQSLYPIPVTTTSETSIRVEPAYSEAQLQASLFSINENNGRSIRATAATYAVPESTLHNRLAGHTSCPSAHEHRQILSSAERKISVRWLSNLSRADLPASSALLFDMAEEVRRSRFKLSEGPSPQLRPLGKNWSLESRSRHRGTEGVWTRQIKTARNDGVNSETLSRCFNAVRALMDEHQYGSQPNP
jgi:hypothetical protein